MKIVDIPLKLQGHLGVFRPLFTRPSYQSFCQMGTAIAVCQKSRTVRNLHDTIAENNKKKKSRRAYNWFFNDAKWDEDKVAQVKADAFFKTIKPKKEKRILLLIDDTDNEKKGKKTDGVGKFFSHAENAFIWGNNFVTSSLQYGNLFIPHKARMYIKEEDAKKDGRFEFKTKPQIAFEEIIEPLEIPSYMRLIVVADSWWFSEQLINSCRGLNHHVICRIKSNKCVEANDSYKQVQKYARNLEKKDFKEITIEARGKKKKYKFFEKITEMENIGKVRLVITEKTTKKKEPKYFISTDLTLTVEEILTIYENRWNIETCHREANQKLGFKEYQMRDKKGIERFIQLVFLMWTMLLLIELRGKIDIDALEIPRLGEMLEGLRLEVFADMFSGVLVFFGYPLPMEGVISTLKRYGYKF